MKHLVFILLLLPALGWAEDTISVDKTTDYSQSYPETLPGMKQDTSSPLVKSQIKEQSGTVLIDANAILPYTQIDSATVNAANVTSLTVGTLAFTGSAPYKILQSSFCTDQTNNSFTTSSYGNTGLKCALTPTSSSSRIMILWMIPTRFSYSNNTVQLNVKIQRNGSDLKTFTDQGLANTNNTSNFLIDQDIKGMWEDSPASTSQQSYSIQYANNGGVGTISANPASTNNYMVMWLLEVVIP